MRLGKKSLSCWVGGLGSRVTGFENPNSLPEPKGIGSLWFGSCFDSNQ